MSIERTYVYIIREDMYVYGRVYICSADVVHVLIKVIGVDNMSEWQHCDTYWGVAYIYQLHGTPQSVFSQDDTILA